MKLRRLLWDEIEKIPYQSGLYFFFDEQVRLLYVGKARRLKARIMEHMDNCVRIFAARKLVCEYPEFQFTLEMGQVIDRALLMARYFGILQIPYSELGAREKELIMKLKPPFNSETNSPEYAVAARLRRPIRGTTARCEGMKGRARDNLFTQYSLKFR